jgi:hypothetical protein
VEEGGGGGGEWRFGGGQEKKQGLEGGFEEDVKELKDTKKKTKKKDLQS